MASQLNLICTLCQFVWILDTSVSNVYISDRGAQVNVNPAPQGTETHPAADQIWALFFII